MQKWEYLVIYKDRGWKGRPKDQPWHEATPWVNIVATSKGERKWEGTDFLKLLTTLGDEGWELVSVSPRSDYLGGVSTLSGFVAFGGGRTEGQFNDYAGFTTCEVWTFKRPKS